jgi:hypothetical protein
MFRRVKRTWWGAAALSVRNNFTCSAHGPRRRFSDDFSRTDPVSPPEPVDTVPEVVDIAEVATDVAEGVAQHPSGVNTALRYQNGGKNM